MGDESDVLMLLQYRLGGLRDWNCGMAESLGRPPSVARAKPFRVCTCVFVGSRVGSHQTINAVRSAYRPVRAAVLPCCPAVGQQLPFGQGLLDVGHRYGRRWDGSVA